MRPNMLAGYRVLDFTQVVAGPTCTRMMAEMGADVIKIELAPGGDRGRIAGLRPMDRRDSSLSTYFTQHNHSKKCIAVDWKSPKTREIIRALVQKADVVVENFAPGVMGRAGYAYEDLSKLNPKLVMCSISVAGQNGPLASMPGYDVVGQSYAGITGLIGDPDGDPALISMAIGDVSTGLAAAMAVGFALLHRERTGEGQYIDCSILDTYFNMHETNIPRVTMANSPYDPKRTGTQWPDGGPAGIFRCGDGQHIAMMVLTHQWPQMVKALGMPELANDPRFKTSRGRRDNNDAMKDIMEGWLARFPTREEAIKELEAHRIPVAPVMTLRKSVAHPHLNERHTIRYVDDRLLGRFGIPGMPAKFSKFPEQTEGLRASLLGEDNETVMRELGLSDHEISTLYAEKVLVRDPMLEEPGIEARKE